MSVTRCTLGLKRDRLEDQLNKASKSKGKKIAPGYVFVMGLSAPDICIMS